MAVEARRGCGYRKIGGLYLVSGNVGQSCDRLPFPLHVCSTCGQGIKQSRGWTWVNSYKLFDGNHKGCKERRTWTCVICDTPPERAGLLWTGGKFYKKTDDFMNEARTMGVSRRISAIPKGLKLGETWILMAHPKAVYNVDIPSDDKFEFFNTTTEEIVKEKWTPGIFTAFKPTAIEKIITDLQAKDKTFMEEIEAHSKKVGVEIKPVIVPHDDPDHQGSVYDKENGDEG